MFALKAMQGLINAKPFVPFRLWTSDGGHVDVISRELVIVGRQGACIGLLDRNTPDMAADRWTVIWYLHVTRVEYLTGGQPPFAPAEQTGGTPTPSSV